MNENTTSISGTDLDQLRTLIADDGYAMTFQTLAQYRTALLKAVDARRAHPQIADDPRMASLSKAEQQLADAKRSREERTARLGIADGQAAGAGELADEYKVTARTLNRAAFISGLTYQMYEAEISDLHSTIARLRAALTQPIVPAAAGAPAQALPDERALFEAWYSPMFGTPKRLGESEQYQMSSAQGAWQAWQARAAVPITLQRYQMDMVGEPVPIDEGEWVKYDDVHAALSASPSAPAVQAAPVGYMRLLKDGTKMGISFEKLEEPLIEGWVQVPVFLSAHQTSAPAVQAEPVAWALFAPNGNIRVWTSAPDEVRRLATECGKDLVPLYTGAAPAEQATQQSEMVDRDSALRAEPAAAAALPEPLIFKLAAEHELTTRKLFGQIVFGANEIVAFTRAVELAIATRCRAEGGNTKQEPGAAAPLEAHAGAVDAQTQAARDVLTERRRQVEQEGWTPEHDDAHAGGQMAVAAGYYALACGYPHERDIGRGAMPSYWPWAPSWWKPKGRRANLVKAGALVLAEIERLDRAASQQAPAPITDEKGSA